MKRIFSIAVLGVMLGLLYGVYSASQNPPASAPLALLTPPEQQKRREKAQELVEQAKKIEQSAKRGEKQVFQLSATQEQINTLLQDRLKIQNLPISNLQIALGSGLVRATGDAKYGGLTVPVALNATPQVEAGALKLNVVSLTLAGLPAPEQWKAKTQKAIGDGLQSLFSAQKTARFDSVKVESGVLHVRGTTG